MRVLVTAFEPFGGDAENASAQAVGRLAERPGLHREILPVEFGVAGDRVVALARELRPDVVLCVGEAGRRSRVSVEREAFNLRVARIPDNAGRQPHDEKVVDGRHAVLSTDVDVEAVAAAVRDAGVPAHVSGDPGRFVCNEVYFRALADLDAPTVFVHVPAVRSGPAAGTGAETDDDTEPGLLPSADDLVVALEAVLSSLAPSGRRG